MSQFSKVVADGVTLPTYSASGLVPLVAVLPGCGNGILPGDGFGCEPDRALLLLRSGRARLSAAAEHESGVTTAQAAKVDAPDAEDVTVPVDAVAQGDVPKAGGKKGAVPRPRS